MRSIDTKGAAQRLAWETPKVIRLEAGAAENGQGTLADGGGPGASRS